MNEHHWYNIEPDGLIKRFWHRLERIAYDAGGRGINSPKDGNNNDSK